MVSIGQIFQNLVKPKSASVVGIDISSSSVKVVELTRKQGRASLMTYGELALGPYAGLEVGRATTLPVEKVVEALRDILQEAKVTTKSAGIAIPMSSSLIRLIEMPDLGEEKLKKMIPLEVRKYIPVPLSDVLLDWWIIPREVNEPDGSGDQMQNEVPVTGTEVTTKKVDVLVVAIHNDIISRYQEIVQKAGLASSFFEIEIFSTLRSVLGREEGPVMIVDVGAASTKVYVVEKGVIRSSHIVNSGSQDITLSLSSNDGLSVEAAETKKREGEVVVGTQGAASIVVDNILFEAKRVRVNYERKSHKKIKGALFTGGGSIVAGLNNRATSVLELPVEIADPFSRVEAPDFMKDFLKKVGPGFSVALGIALRKLDE